MAEVLPAIPPDALEACSAAETAAEAPNAGNYTFLST